MKVQMGGGFLRLPSQPWDSFWGSEWQQIRTAFLTQTELHSDTGEQLPTGSPVAWALLTDSQASV